MNIIDFFPIPIGIVELDKKLTDDELKFFKNHENDTVVNIGGNLTSKKRNVLEDENLHSLKNALTTQINKYFKEVFEPETNIELFITQSWLNFNRGGDSHHIHTHTNSLLSGVFYIDVDVCQDDKICFENENNLLGTIEIFSDKRTKWNTKEWVCPVIKNQLIIFPSKIKHGVPQRPHTQKDVRISLAFNTWFKGEVGGSIQLNSLKC